MEACSLAATNPKMVRSTRLARFLNYDKPIGKVAADGYQNFCWDSGPGVKPLFKTFYEGPPILRSRSVDKKLFELIQD